MLRGDLGMLDPPLDEPPEVGHTQLPWAPPRQGFISGQCQNFRWLDTPAPGHSRKDPHLPRGAFVLSLDSTLGPWARCYWKAASLLPSPALTATWHLCLGLCSSLEDAQIPGCDHSGGHRGDVGSEVILGRFARPRKGVSTWVLP